MTDIFRVLVVLTIIANLPLQLGAEAALLRQDGHSSGPPVCCEQCDKSNNLG